MFSIFIESEWTESELRQIFVAHFVMHVSICSVHRHRAQFISVYAFSTICRRDTLQCISDERRMRKCGQINVGRTMDTWLMAESDADETKTYYINVIMVDELVSMITFCSEFLYAVQRHLCGMWEYVRRRAGNWQTKREFASRPLMANRWIDWCR